MKRIAFLMLAFSLALSACGAFPQPSPTPSEDELATQVSAILTSMPTAVGAATEIPTAEPPAPTEPVQATEPVVATATEATASGETPTQAGYPAPGETPVAETAAPSPTHTVAQTPVPTFTPPATDPKLKLGGASWTDTFSDDRNWPLGDDKYTKAEVKDGALVMTGLSTIDGWRLTWPKLKDFYMEVTVKTGECKISDRYGMIVRVPDIKTADQGYLFGFTCDGRYALRKWDGKEMTSLIAWTASDAIQAGANQTNRLGLMAVGDRLILYANGTLLKEARDNTFSEGGFGLWIGANQTENFTVQVEEVAYWENPTP